MVGGVCKVRNCSIDIFRYICAILVVAIHTRPFTDISEALGFFSGQVVTRVAVPFFFAVAGYFYIAKLEKGEKPFFQYFKRLLITYAVWSIFYYAISMCFGEKIGFKSLVFGFFVTGSHYHLWFFPAILFSVCLTTLIYKIKCKKVIAVFSIVLYIIGCLGCAYYEVGKGVPVLGTLFNLSVFTSIRRIVLMGFPFFVCGGVILKIKERFSRSLNLKKLCFSWLVAAAFFLVEIYAVTNFRLSSNVVLTFGLYPLVIITILILMGYPMSGRDAVSKKCRVLANFTYYSHPFFMVCIQKLSEAIFKVTISQTPMFFMTIAVTLVFGLVICRVNSKIINYIL